MRSGCDEVDSGKQVLGNGYDGLQVDEVEKGCIDFELKRQLTVAER